MAQTIAIKTVRLKLAAEFFLALMWETAFLPKGHSIQRYRDVLKQIGIREEDLLLELRLRGNPESTILLNLAEDNLLLDHALTLQRTLRGLHESPPAIRVLQAFASGAITEEMLKEPSPGTATT